MGVLGPWGGRGPVSAGEFELQGPTFCPRFYGVCSPQGPAEGDLVFLLGGKASQGKSQRAGHRVGLCVCAAVVCGVVNCTGVLHQHVEQLTCDLALLLAETWVLRPGVCGMTCRVGHGASRPGRPWGRHRLLEAGVGLGSGKPLVREMLLSIPKAGGLARRGVRWGMTG